MAWGRYDPFRRLLYLTDYTEPVPDNLADPLVRRALALPELRAFARWSTMPMARIDRERCRARVSFGDARYGRTVAANRFGEQAVVATAGAGC